MRTRVHRNRKARLVPDARYASVRVTAERIEIALYDQDPAWMDRVTAILEDHPNLPFVLYYPGTDGLIPGPERTSNFIPTAGEGRR